MKAQSLPAADPFVILHVVPMAIAYPQAIVPAMLAGKFFSNHHWRIIIKCMALVTLKRVGDIRCHLK